MISGVFPYVILGCLFCRCAKTHNSANYIPKISLQRPIPSSFIYLDIGDTCLDFVVQQLPVAVLSAIKGPAHRRLRAPTHNRPQSCKGILAWRRSGQYTRLHRDRIRTTFTFFHSHTLAFPKRPIYTLSVSGSSSFFQVFILTRSPRSAFMVISWRGHSNTA